MTGQVTAELGRPNFRGGRFELLTKPFRPDGLLRAVRTALERAPGRGPGGGTGTGDEGVLTSSLISNK
jgi:hypothetical protein